MNAGATWIDKALVQDRNWVSSRGPQDMVVFVRGMIALFSGAATQSPEPVPAQSSPQRNNPPQLVVNAMAWLPRPSVRAALVIGLVGYWALSRTRNGASLGARLGRR